MGTYNRKSPKELELQWSSRCLHLGHIGRDLGICLYLLRKSHFLSLMKDLLVELKQSYDPSYQKNSASEFCIIIITLLNYSFLFLRQGKQGVLIRPGCHFFSLLKFIREPRLIVTVFSFGPSLKVFNKTRLLGRGFHSLIKHTSFPSPTDVGSHTNFSGVIAKKDRIEKGYHNTVVYCFVP